MRGGKEEKKGGKEKKGRGGEKGGERGGEKGGRGKFERCLVESVIQSKVKHMFE